MRISAVNLARWNPCQLRDPSVIRFSRALLQQMIHYLHTMAIDTQRAEVIPRCSHLGQIIA